ncbi:MAG: hypothetical protein IPM79_31280 [Polyangiaceae bacterium]|nr:hypothetical protein [Polyangiaceae bacterium]MBK8941967.1 hypothetical protein [Polyangiaceae bacterium]
MTASAPAPTESRPRGARLRIDEIDLRVVRGSAEGARGSGAIAIVAGHPVTAATQVVLPAFDGWLGVAEVVLRLEGHTAATFDLRMHLGGARGAVARVGEGSGDGPVPFHVELRAPLSELTALLGETTSLSIVAQPVGSTAAARTVALVDLTLQRVEGSGPHLASIELSDITDAELYGASERRSFDLQNPEEGFWRGSGKALLRLTLTWASPEGSGWRLERRLERLSHALAAHGALQEDAAQRRARAAVTETELVFDTGHADLGAIPEEGKDVLLAPEGAQALEFKLPGDAPDLRGGRARLLWSAPLAVRVRDPRPHLKTFQRLSAVGIDFGTSSTVAALVQRGYRSLLQLGRPPEDGAHQDESARAAENPAVLLVEDHEQLWAQMETEARFPYLARVVRGSHAALAAQAEAPNSVVGQLKLLPERVLGLDASPQLRDRAKQHDFLLDEARVRALVRAYAYLLGRAINRPGQDVFLHYVLTHPSKGDAKIRALLDEEVKKGLQLALPEDIPASELRVEAVASEAEAFAVEVCPELCAHPDVAPLVERHGELRFVVFDLGGGTLDVACGRFRPATEEEQSAHGSSTVIETLQVNGQPDLGGDVLTHELAWLVHQHPSVLPEMEAKDVPMMRPVTVPVNHLARKPELYKRGLAARQNWLRIERALRLERVKYGPAEAPHPAAGLALSRIDGTETTVDALGGDLSAVAASLRAHLMARIHEGTTLLESTMASAKWPNEAVEPQGSLLDRGILVLLAGNSSRSAFVAQAVAEELGLAKPGEAFEPWRPDSARAPLSGVVLWETPARTERGVTIVGVTPKTAVALGALKLANHEVHLVRATQGFGYFLGDLRGFPPKFAAIVPMGAPSGKPGEPGPHMFDFGRWDTKMPLRVSREYLPGKMTSNDPRVFLVPTGLPPGQVGRLYVAVVAPDEIVLCLDRAGSGDGAEPLVAPLSLTKALR